MSDPSSRMTRTFLLATRRWTGKPAVIGAETDVVEPAEIAEGDAPGLVDAVVADAIVSQWLGDVGPRLDAGVEGVQGRVAVEGAMGPLLVVVGAEGVELAPGGRRAMRAGACLARYSFWV